MQTKLRNSDGSGTGPERLRGAPPATSVRATSRRPGVAGVLRTLALLAAVGASVAPAHAQHSAFIEIWSATLTVGARGQLRGYEFGEYGGLSEGSFTYAGQQFRVMALTVVRDEGLTNAPDDDLFTLLLTVASTDPAGTDRYRVTLPYTALFQIEARGDQYVFEIPANSGYFLEANPRDYPGLDGLSAAKRSR